MPLKATYLFNWLNNFNATLYGICIGIENQALAQQDRNHKEVKGIIYPHAIKLIYNHIQQTCIDVMGNLQTLRAKNK